MRPEGTMTPGGLSREDQTGAALGLSEITVRRGGRTILDLDRWSLPMDGGVSALIGPNGAGKTTLLRLLQGLIAPDSGRMDWPDGGPPARAILLQNPVLLRRSVAGNIDFVLKRRGLSRAERRRETDALLAQARLSDAAGRPARRLSGGQQRRLALARALAQAPRMLLLDEPTAGLDPAAAAALERMVRAAAGDGIAVVLSSHEMGQVRRLADRALFLNGGRAAAAGPLPTLFDDPPSNDLDAFLKGDLLC